MVPDDRLVWRHSDGGGGDDDDDSARTRACCGCSCGYGYGCGECDDRDRVQVTDALVMAGGLAAIVAFLALGVVRDLCDGVDWRVAVALGAAPGVFLVAYLACLAHSCRARRRAADVAEADSALPFSSVLLHGAPPGDGYGDGNRLLAGHPRMVSPPRLVSDDDGGDGSLADPHRPLATGRCCAGRCWLAFPTFFVLLAFAFYQFVGIRHWLGRDQ
jgi:hypothetical protein